MRVVAAFAFLLAVQPNALAAVGEPDLFGYTFIDSNEAGGPAYNFQDISALGTTITLTDESTSRPIPIGFTFQYYGIDYTALEVCSNGYLTVVQGQAPNWGAPPMPNPAAPNGIIGGLATDLDPGAGGTVHYLTLGAAPNRRFIVQFTNVPQWTIGGIATFQIKLFEGSNNIEYHYTTVPAGGWTQSVGIENQNGTVGLQYSRSAAGLPTPLAIRFFIERLRVTAEDFYTTGPQGGPFSPPSKVYVLTNEETFAVDWSTTSPQPWISVAPTTGSLTAGTSTTVIVSINSNANALPMGNHLGTFTVFNDTAGSIPHTRNVRLTALDHLQVRPITGFFSTGPEGGPYTTTSLTYRVTNVGPIAINWTATKTAAWFDVFPAAGVLPPGNSRNVAVSLNSNAYTLIGGLYTDSLVFTNVDSGITTARTVTLDILNAVTIPFYDGFESGDIEAYWRVTGTNDYRTTATTLNAPHSGSYHLRMDDRISGVAYSRNELTLAVDLVRAQDVRLSFWMKEFGDEDHGPPPSPFIGSADFDGVAISADGVRWYEVQGLRSGNGISGAYRQFVVDLDAAAASRGLSYNSAFRIRFNHYDDYPVATDGFAFDDISIAGFYDDLAVSPKTGLASVGMVGGPLVPVSRDYTLTNEGSAPLQWAAVPSAGWIDAIPSGGTLAGGTTTTVEVALNSMAQALPAGNYATSVSIVNINSGNSFVRNVTLLLYAGPVVDLDSGLASLPLMRIYGDDPSDLLGSDLSNGIAFGDVNGDGFDDMIVGAPYADPPGGPSAGEVYVIYGSASMPVPVVDLNTDGAISPTSETRILGDDSGDLAGYSVASGDVNGDGFDDVILGAVIADTTGGLDAGEVYVVYGRATLPGTIVDLNTNGAISLAGETRILGDDAGDELGYSVASGDVNGDGFDDVILGAVTADTTGGLNAGEVYVVYGSAALPATIVDLNTTGAISAAGETRILGDDLGDQAGYSVASGDVNGDGYDDVILGVVAGDTTGGLDSGEVYVIYGGVGLPATIVDLNTTGAISAAGETRILGDDPSDYAGYSVASGDVNGDGFDDVIVGAVIADTPGGLNAGEVYVIYGSASLPASIVDLNTDGAISAAGETRILGDDVGDYAGYAVASSDVNGDGFDDVIVGAIAADPPGGPNAGEAYVIHGRTSLSSSTVDLNSVWGNMRFLGDNAGDNWGLSAEGGGDVNRDGFAEFANSAYYGDNPSIGGNNNTGAAAVVFGNGVTTGSANTMEFFMAGNTPERGFGGRLSPVMRAWLAFDGGTSGAAWATVTRDDGTISNLGNGSKLDVADVRWLVTTGRTGYSAAHVTFQYLDSEIAGLGDEAGLRLYQAPLPYGMWREVTTQSLDIERNVVSATVNSLSFFALLGDHTSPTVTVEQAAAQADPTNVLPITFDVTFSENVIGFDAGDVTMGGTAMGTSFTVTGSGSSYTLQVISVLYDGTVVPSIAAGVCTDAAGNRNTASTSVDNSVLLDRIAPTVTMNSATSNPTNVSPMPVTVTFSEPVIGFTSAGITVSNATVTSFTGTGAAYSFDLTPAGQGLVTADIPAGVAHDAAGNDNTSATQLSRMFDNVAPTVAMDSFVPDPTNFPFIPVMVSFSETPADFDPLDVAVTNGLVVYLAGSATDYTFFLIPLSPGQVTATIAAGTVHDAAGNGTSPTAQFSRVYDNSPPVVTASLRADANPTSAPSVSFLVTFNEGVTAVDVGDFALTATGVTSPALTGVSGTATTYSVTVNTGSGDGTIRLDVIDSDAIADLAGNWLGGVGPGNGSFLTGQAYTIDKTAPQTQVTGPPSPLNTTDTIILVTFTGADAGTGLRGVLLFYRRGAVGPFLQYGDMVTSSPIAFDTTQTGGNGMYELYTIGIDLVGNVEAAKTKADMRLRYNDQTGVRRWRGYR